MKIKEFYTDESKWCKEVFGINTLGKIIEDIQEIRDTKLSNIRSMSIFAAICKFYTDPRSAVEVEGQIKKLLKIPQDRTISEWESNGERSFEEIKILVEYLNI